MRLDFVQRQKQWEAEQARSAPAVFADAMGEDEEEGGFAMPISSSGEAMQFFTPSATQWQATQEEADEVAQRENEELEALLSFLPGEEMNVSQSTAASQYQDYNQPESQQEDEQMSEHFGSDDDDYEALFSDFINAEAHEAAVMGGERGSATQVPESSGGDAMDMS